MQVSEIRLQYETLPSHPNQRISFSESGKVIQKDIELHNLQIKLIKIKVSFGSDGTEQLVAKTVLRQPGRKLSKCHFVILGGFSRLLALYGLYKVEK